MGGFINREHPGGVPNPGRLFASQLPGHVTIQGRHKVQILDVVFLIEDGLVEVGNTPTFRDVEVKQLS